MLEKKFLMARNYPPPPQELNGRPLIYLSLKADENQKNKQIKIRCCTWAFCATVHKGKVYVLRLKVTHTARTFLHSGQILCIVSLNW